MHIHANFPVNATVRQLYPWRGKSQGQKTFLAPCVDNRTRNYYIEYSNHHPSVSTLRSKGMSHNKIKW